MSGALAWQVTGALIKRIDLLCSRVEGRTGQFFLARGNSFPALCRRLLLFLRFAFSVISRCYAHPPHTQQLNVSLELSAYSSIIVRSGWRFVHKMLLLEMLSSRLLRRFWIRWIHLLLLLVSRTN